MASFIKITDNLSINIDCIYSVYREENVDLPLNLFAINNFSNVIF